MIPTPPVASVRRIGGRHPSPADGLQREQRLNRGRGPIGALAVGLVDHEDVGDLHDPGLQRLHIVSGAGYHDDDRDVGGADDLDLVLPDADGLDEHDVEAGRIEHERHVVSRPRQAAEMPARGHAADEDALVARMLLHAHAVAEQRAAREGAGRIDGDDADAAATRAPLPREAIREGTLAGARRPGQADDGAAPGMGMEGGTECGGPRPFVLDHGDRARDGAKIAGTHAIGEVVDGHASSCRAITRRCTSLVPSPMVRSFTSRKYFSAG